MNEAKKNTQAKPLAYWQFFILLIVISLGSVYYTFNYAIEFSAFAVAFAKVLIALFLWYLFDLLVLTETETVNEIIKEKNMPLAIFFLGYAIIVAACVATA